jgi:hypothetical protein
MLSTHKAAQKTKRREREEGKKKGRKRGREGRKKKKEGGKLLNKLKGRECLENPYSYQALVAHNYNPSTRG